MQLTLKQEKFVNAYVSTGNGTLAVKEAGYNVANNNVAGRIASANVRKGNIKQAIAKKKADIIKILEDNSMLILTNMLEIAFNQSTPIVVRLKALQDLLDRAGYSAKNNLAISGGDSIVIETRHTSELAKRARKLLKEVI